MFLELWERLRGYDKWVETQATVERSDVSATTYGTRSGEDLVVCEAGDVISWSDASGEKQYATFDVEEGNSLFELVTGESVTIRYDPAHPDRFYYRDLVRLQVKSVCRRILTLAVIASLVAVFIWTHRH